MDTLEKRVETLERENQKLRRGAVVALVLIGAVGVMGQAPSPTVLNKVATRHLGIVDQAGKVRMFLTAINGQPSMNLLDQEGKIRASLGLLEGKAGLTLFDQDGPRGGAPGDT